MKSLQKITFILFIFSSVVLQGCVNRKPISQEEWKEMVKAEHLEEEAADHSYTRRVITGKSPNQILTASNELFTLMDGSDMKIEQTEDAVSAMRSWFIWALIVSLSGYDYWNVTAHPSPEKSTDTIVNITQASESIGQMAGVGTSVGAPNMSISVGGGQFSTKAKLYKDEAAYQLFWSRLEFLLGISDKWVSCKEAVSWAENNNYKGKLRAMCELSSDNTPQNT